MKTAILTAILAMALTLTLIFYRDKRQQTIIDYSKPVSKVDSLICAHFGNPVINTKMRADSVEMIIRQFYPYTREELIVIKTMANLIKDLREMKGE